MTGANKALEPIAYAPAQLCVVPKHGMITKGDIGNIS